MAVATEVQNQNDIYAEERARALGQAITHCPYGCTTGMEGVDERGYCEHLVGFLQGDGKTIELLKKDEVRDRVFVSGAKANRDTFNPKTDIAVNPQYAQKCDDQMTRMASRWVSPRVYRKVEQKKAS